MTSQPVAAYPARDQYAKPLLVALLSGCGVALALGLYAKAWLTTAAVVFAVVQLITGARLTRQAAAPAWMATVHRWSGRIAVLLTVPVIIHCIYALGFGTYSARVIAHSVLGCIFYGAFVTKMLCLVRRDDMPKWVLPVMGGVVFVSLVALWATSALWLFATKGVHS